MNIGQIHQFLGSMDRFISDQSSRIKNAVGDHISTSGIKQTPKPTESSNVEKNTLSTQSDLQFRVQTKASVSKTVARQADLLNVYGRHGQMQTQKAATLGQHIDIKI